MLGHYRRRIGEGMRDEDIPVANQGIQVRPGGIDVRHHPFADEVLGTAKGIHHPPDDVAVGGVDVRPDSVPAQTGRFRVRDVLSGQREDDVMAARGQRASQPQIGIQVAERPERGDDESQERRADGEGPAGAIHNTLTAQTWRGPGVAMRRARFTRFVEIRNSDASDGTDAPDPRNRAAFAVRQLHYCLRRLACAASCSISAPSQGERHDLSEGSAQSGMLRLIPGDPAHPISTTRRSPWMTSADCDRRARL